MIYSQFQRLNKATKKNSLSSCTGVFTKTIGLPCSHAIKTRMEEMKNNLGRILIEDIDVHWHYKKPSGPSTTDFTSDLSAINKTIAESLELMEDADSDQPLSDIDQIMRFAD